MLIENRGLRKALLKELNYPSSTVHDKKSVDCFVSFCEQMNFYQLIFFCLTIVTMQGSQ